MTERDLVVVLVTAPSEDSARTLARTLLQEGLIACANLLPGVRSLYVWEGEVRDEEEVLMMLKTASDRAQEVVSRVSTLHLYEVPEILALPVLLGADDYISWVLKSTGRGRGGGLG